MLKALLLVLVGIGAIKFMHKDLDAAVMHWVQVLRVDPDNRFAHGLLVKIFRVTPKQLKELSVGTFLYAGLFAIEGVGLLLRKRWAEYFTIITTGCLIPLEIYELTEKITALRVIALVINIVAVIWLLWSKRLFGLNGGGKAYREEHETASLLSVERAGLRETAASATP